MAEQREEWATIGGRLTWVRDAKMGDSRRELSNKLGALDPSVRPEHHSDDSVGNYERGDRMPSADYVAAVASLAGVNPGWLLTGEGTPEGQPALPPDAPIRDRVEHAAVVLMGALTRWEDEGEAVPTLPGPGRPSSPGAAADMASRRRDLLEPDEEPPDSDDEDEEPPTEGHA